MATFLRPFSFPRFFLRGVFLTAEKPSAIILTCVILASWMFSHAVIAGDTPAPLRTLRGPRLTANSTGTLPARDGQCLHLITDLGNIEIHTHNSAQIDYRVHLEADASQKNARQLLKTFAVHAGVAPDGAFLKGQAASQSSGRLWVVLEVDIPKNYNLDVSTGGGNVQTDDVNGHVTLSTAGGDIVAGNIGGSARLETKGGHIAVKNVQGELFASTGGGHITRGGCCGGCLSAYERRPYSRIVGWGHRSPCYRRGQCDPGALRGELVAETSGGQIEIGDATGLVRATTGGGGIRLARISGPSELKTVDGSIYLTQVDNAVKASTDAGGITAWFVTPPKRPGPCELDSNDGDIIVHLPRQLPVTIDAQVEMADEHRVIFDPAFPLKVSYADSAKGMRTIRAEGSVNGGGEVLRLRAVEGNIRVVLSDAEKQVQLYNQQMEQLAQQLRVLRLQLRSLLSSEDAAPTAPQH